MTKFLNRLCYVLFVLQLLILPSSAGANETPIARTVVALYDSKVEDGIDSTIVKKHIELYLNFLGLKLTYVDIQKELPTLKKGDGVRAILSCFRSYSDLAQPELFINWARGAIEQNKKIAFLGHLPFIVNAKGRATPIREVNELLAQLGIKDLSSINKYPFDLKIASRDEQILDFDTKVGKVLPPFRATKLFSKQASSHLSLKHTNNEEERYDLVVTNSRGGFVSENYAYKESNPKLGTKFQWYINPINFFRKAFATDAFPKPDLSTLAGRRIFYQIIDGFGFDTRSDVEEYRKKGLSSAQVILDRVLADKATFPASLILNPDDIKIEGEFKERNEKLLESFAAKPQNEIVYIDADYNKASQAMKTFRSAIPGNFWELEERAKATELPFRLKPFVLAYSINYGAELAGYKGLLRSYAYAGALDLHPLLKSQLNEIKQGFDTSKIIPLKDNTWQVKHRAALNTLRFDRASFRVVDFKKSKGVVGYTHLHGSLYVYLDRQEQAPLVRLKEVALNASQAKSRAYLIDSPWQVWNLKQKKQAISFQAQGYGEATMHWHVPWKKPLKLEVAVLDDPSVEPQVINLKADKNGEVSFSISDIRNHVATISIKEKSAT